MGIPGISLPGNPSATITSATGFTAGVTTMLPGLPFQVSQARFTVASDRVIEKCYVVPGARGGLLLAWYGSWPFWEGDPPGGRPEPVTHFQPLADDLRPVAGAFDAPKGLRCEALTRGPDGALYMLGLGEDRSELTNLYLLKFDADGRQLYQRLIIGGGGIGPGAYDYGNTDASIAVAGGKIALFYGIGHNFAKPGGPDDAHQGDQYKELDLDGNEDPAKTVTWAHSHSFQTTVRATETGACWRTTMTDAGRYGAVFINPATGVDEVVWPVEKLMAPDPPPNEYGGWLGGMTEMGRHAFAGLGTEERPRFERGLHEESTRPLVLKLDEHGQLLRHAWLADAKLNSALVRCARLGDKLLVGWGSQFDDYADTSMALLDPETLAVVGPATKVAVRNTHSSPWTELPSGDVAWASNADETQDSDGLGNITVQRVRP